MLSTIVKARKRRPSARLSDTKSRLQRSLGRSHNPSGAGPLLTDLWEQGEPYEPVQAEDPLGIHLPAFALEQDVQAAVAVPHASGRELPEPDPRAAFGPQPRCDSGRSIAGHPAPDTPVVGWSRSRRVETGPYPVSGLASQLFG
jgi:hypothetical protein